MTEEVPGSEAHMVGLTSHRQPVSRHFPCNLQDDRLTRQQCTLNHIANGGAKRPQPSGTLRSILRPATYHCNVGPAHVCPTTTNSYQRTNNSCIAGWCCKSHLTPVRSKSQQNAPTPNHMCMMGMPFGVNDAKLPQCSRYSCNLVSVALHSQSSALPV